MSEQKAFRVEVTIKAPLDTVWHAVSEPSEIREWFGWDYPGIEGEIREIFVDNAKQVRPHRIGMEGGGQEILLTAEGPLTRVVAQTAEEPQEGDDSYDVIEQGWRSFFEQLRYRLERRPSGHRRTVYLAGTVKGLDLDGAEEVWHESRYQRMVIDGEGHLIVAQAQQPLESGDEGWVGVTVSTYGLDDAAFSVVRERWAARWQEAARDPEVTP